jgi:toxin ParE1/3/4
MPLHFAPKAVRDIQDIGDYIGAENPAAAARLIDALEARCARIEDAPRAGVRRPELKTGLRSIAFQRYVIFYTLQEDVVRIERVLHGARDIEALFAEDE